MALPVYTDLDLNSNEIKNDRLEQLAADPTGVGLWTGRRWFNTTSNLAKYYDGTSVQVLASQAYVIAQLNALGQIQGGFSALAGALPTAAAKTQGDLTAIKKGDFWVITTAGTIAGLSGGATQLSVGDLIQFYGASPTTAADWIAIERNLNDSLVGNAKTERQTVSLVANTALAVNAATISDIHSVNVYDSAGTLILLDVQKLGGANQRTLTSKKSLSNIVVELVGAL